jgi:hypothetical protein
MTHNHGENEGMSVSVGNQEVTDGDSVAVAHFIRPKDQFALA